MPYVTTTKEHTTTETEMGVPDHLDCYSHIPIKMQCLFKLGNIVVFFVEKKRFK